ncbi:hypothetical protein CALVIDRAFT_568453 [Calocera viscosa TUFC12733]|uniref:Uncharacterized protein n=1 Tax=Calocera viscosa (strain TUFC12733) TaxID=1330018 RepID=A0A167H386_CALVF|nr:hypothetical protein CALVIDRAFT_568453 [Calocera viscosa TUFC12733]
MLLPPNHDQYTHRRLPAFDMDSTKIILPYDDAAMSVDKAEWDANNFHAMLFYAQAMTWGGYAGPDRDVNQACGAVLEKEDTNELPDEYAVEVAFSVWSIGGDGNDMYDTPVNINDPASNVYEYLSDSSMLEDDSGSSDRSFDPYTDCGEDEERFDHVKGMSFHDAHIEKLVRAFMILHDSPM